MIKPAFLHGIQYYRPPFPAAEYWQDDLRRMADAGLNAVQLWLPWGWCEPEPGRFVFDDYERIADLAGNVGLGVVPSTLPEINPFWLPRVVPDGLMIDVEGRAVLSCNRTECLAGLVPGLCSDHADVRARMVQFLETTAARFGPRENLLAWDCWNENRWRNHAPEMVCFCESSLRDFRAFLQESYGSLEGLGRAWGRRYCDWQDVRVGRLYGNSYPEMHDFTRWICHRGAQMAQWRVAALRRGDGHHPITSHTGNPSVFGGLALNENVFCRGIDWDVAAGDGYGYSSFPSTDKGEMAPAELCLRMTAAMTAGAGKPVWMSELQGGTACISGAYGPPLRGRRQQTWVWTGIARGAKACIYWAWRNEFFSSETNGFGMTANDGYADERLQYVARTAAVLREHEQTLAAFVPDRPQVAVLFQRDSYFYDWMGARSIFRSNYDAPARFLAWPLGLEQMNLPYCVLDDRHLPGDDHGLRLVIVPDAEGLDDAAAHWLLRFAQSGGVVLLEGVPGMRGSDTFFREPHQRPLQAKLGLQRDILRALSCSQRTIPAGTLGNAQPITLSLSCFELLYPEHEHAVQLEPDGAAMLATAPVGQGRLISIGSIVGMPTQRQAPQQLVRLLESLAGLAGLSPWVTMPVAGESFVTARLGGTSTQRLLLVSNFGPAQTVTMDLPASVWHGQAIGSWFGHLAEATQRSGRPSLRLSLKEDDHAALAWTR